MDLGHLRGGIRGLGEPRFQCGLSKESGLSSYHSTTIKSPVKQWTEDLNRHFSKKDTQMDHRHMKRCSTSLIIQEMQIKTTVRYYLTLVRKTIIKKSSSNKYWKGCKKREPSYTVGGNVNWYSHYRE